MTFITTWPCGCRTIGLLFYTYICDKHFRQRQINTQMPKK